jgi:hypothetical protein
VLTKVFYHIDNFCKEKDYYLYSKMDHSPDFTKLVSYNQSVELQKQTIIPLMLFLILSCTNNATEISFIDSTKLQVCNNRRIYSLKGLLHETKRLWDSFTVLNSI